MTENTRPEKDLKNTTWYRDGPKPLLIHVNIALSRCAAKEINQDQVNDLLAGIKKYQAHPFRRSMSPLETVWSQKDVALLFSPSVNGNAHAAVFIIPSLINKSHILDLLPERSFVRWLSAQGFDVYLLDWGVPAANSDLADMEGVIDGTLSAALKFLERHCTMPLFSLGYCMGGTLLAGLCALHKNSLSGAIYLASPWDFEAGDRRLAELAQSGIESAHAIIEQRGVLPMDWTQTLFARVDPDHALHKFSSFLQRDDDDSGARFFVAVEDWLNDGLDLPGAVANCCMIDWYEENKPLRGEWQVGGRKVDLSGVSMPSLIVASAKDRLVPCGSSLALARQIEGAGTLQPDIGHIGMMTGGRAEELVWQPIANWIRNLL